MNVERYDDSHNYYGSINGYVCLLCVCGVCVCVGGGGVLNEVHGAGGSNKEKKYLVY